MRNKPCPIVSIITPSYNQGQFIEETIQSVLKQDYPNIEYIIIDGGSLDGTVKIIKKYEQFLAYWISEPDRGQAHAINKGLSRAKGELLGWLNADDILLPGTVSRIVEEFFKNPEIDVIYGRLDRINENSDLIPTPILPKDKVEFNKSMVIGDCVVNQPGCFWRRKIMDQVGFLDETLHYGLDYDYWIRMALAGAIFKRLPDTVAYFRLSSTSKTVRATTEMALEQLQILDRTLSLEQLPTILGLPKKEILCKAKNTKSRIYLHAFYGYFKERKIGTACKYLWQSIKLQPLILFERKWFDLARTGIKRRISSR